MWIFLASCEKAEIQEPAPQNLSVQEKSSGSKTCQSIMIAVDALEEIIIEESQTWHFSKRDAWRAI